MKKKPSFNSDTYFIAGVAIVTISFVLYLMSRVCIMKSNPNLTVHQKDRIKAVSLIDFISSGFFLLLKSEVMPKNAIETLMNSKAGLFLITACSLGGFLIVFYYNQRLLSNLTVPIYEKKIGTIQGNF